MLSTYNFYQPIGIMVILFNNDQGDWGSITGRVIPKTQKRVLDASLLKPLQYQVSQAIQGK